MVAYRYFVKTLGKSRYSPLHFVRVPVSDARIEEMTTQYDPIGYSVEIYYPYTPTLDQELFELKKRIQGWDRDVTIGGIGEKTGVREGQLA